MYHIYYCWNGNKRQVAWDDSYESEEEWLFDIESLVLDVLDMDDRNCWVDYGDNDEE